MKLGFNLRSFVMLAMMLVFTMAHDGEGCCAGDAEVLGPPTGTECAPASTLTYANFGEAFMTAYCTRCHSSELRGDARMGAPALHDFNTQVGVQVVGEHIDQTAGSGPNGTNDSMPPDGDMPSLEERRQLAEWMACGAQ